MLKNHLLLPEILKYIHGRREASQAAQPNKVQIWADEDERKKMRECHKRSLEILRTFLSCIGRQHKLRALDVAGGDGRLTTFFLTKHYAKVDLFDRCPVAVEKARSILKNKEKLGYIEQSTM